MIFCSELRSLLRSLALGSGLAATALAGAAAECRLSGSESARVAGSPDGRTLLLGDGREILLAGIETAPAWPGAQAALTRVAGQEVVLRGLSQPDRYGRINAFVFVSGSETPVQYDLLREGLVRAAGAVDSPGCRAGLLAQERKARAAGVGLWSDPVYGIRRADDAATGQLAQGQFAIVEGRVLSVRDSGGTIYVNFGRRWSEDFTATIPKRLDDRFTEAGLAPHSLSGRLVRIRGIVEERGGPWIEVTRPDQIEFAEMKQ
jgi:endonuclease YncB( thermonuclease family)